MAQIAIDGPARVQPERGGLLDIANVTDEVPKGLLYHGFKYASAHCGKNRVIPAEGVDKVPDQGGETEGVLFGAYRYMEGPLLLTPDAPLDAARTAFLNSESYGVERGVQTGLLNSLAVDITPTPGTPITNPRHALGLLEQHAADNYAGLPTIHGNKLAVLLIPELRVSDDFRLHTVHGTPISNGGGYGAVGPGAIEAPVIALGTTGTTGGTFAAGTYYWTVTATNAEGETLESNEVSQTLVLNGTQELTWAAVDGATGYTIYRGTAAGNQTVNVASVGAVTSYTDTGTAGTADTPPTTNTTATTATSGQAWLYITGQVNIWRGPLAVYPTYGLKENRSYALAERQYGASVECDYVAAVLVSI